MEQEKHNHHSGSLHGFVLGILVGVAITLLFTTKKGRRILKSMTDEGMEKVSKWEDLINKKIDEKVNDLNDDLEENEFIEVVEEPVSSVNEAATTEEDKAPSTLKDPKKSPEKEPSSSDATTEKSEVRHTVRRFFKTAKKK